MRIMDGIATHRHTGYAMPGELWCAFYARILCRDGKWRGFTELLFATNWPTMLARRKAAHGDSEREAIERLTQMNR